MSWIWWNCYRVLVGTLTLLWLPVPYSVSARKHLLWSEQFSNTSKIGAIIVGPTGWRVGNYKAPRVTYEPPYSANLTSVMTALAYHYSQDLVFWGDSGSRCIHKATLSLILKEKSVSQIDNSSQSETVFCGTSGMVDGLAVDWLSGLVYWTDRVYRTISVVSHRTYRSKTLISSGMDKPGGITVLPQFGYMFWSDRGTVPRIERANLLGQNRTVLVSSEITEPTDITSDPVTGNIFYLDRKTGIVQMMDIDGRNRRTLIFHVTSTNAYWINVFGIAVSKDFIFVSNGVTQKEIRIYQRSSGEWLETIILEGIASDVVTFDHYMQPVTLTECWRLSCEHMCINIGNGNGTCVCADGYVLYENGISCKDISVKPVVLPPASFPYTWMALGLLLAFAIVLITLLLGLMTAICRYRRRKLREKKRVVEKPPLTAEKYSGENGSMISANELNFALNKILESKDAGILHENQPIVPNQDIPNTVHSADLPEIHIYAEPTHNAEVASLYHPPSLEELEEIESTLALVDQALEGQIASRDSYITRVPNGNISNTVDDSVLAPTIIGGAAGSLRVPNGEPRVDQPISVTQNHTKTKDKIHHTPRSIFKSKKRAQTGQVRKENSHKKQTIVRFKDFVDNEDNGTLNQNYGQVGSISADPIRARRYWKNRDDGVVLRPGLAWKPQLSREAKGFAPASHGVPVGTMLQTLRTKSHHKPMKMFIKR